MQAASLITSGGTTALPYSPTAQPIGAQDGRHVGLGDLNNDGYLDAFVSNLGEANRVWTNDGSGALYDSGQLLGNASGRGVALGDMNGDGSLDAFCANRNEANTLWLNDGQGIFTNSGLALGTASSWWPSLGDINGDGTLDVYVPNLGEADEVWFNPPLYIIQATCNAYGSIAPSGTIEVVSGNSTNFVITATTYYHINQLLTNGVADPAADSLIAYTSSWDNVTADGTIHASFAMDTADHGTPYWWLAAYGLTNSGESFNQAETNDTDGDEFHADAEWIADTDPTDSNSFFHVVAMSNITGHVLFFESSSNRLYSLEHSEHLESETWNGITGQTNQPGNGGMFSLSDTNRTDYKAYRLKVSIP